MHGSLYNANLISVPETHGVGYPFLSILKDMATTYGGMFDLHWWLLSYHHAPINWFLDIWSNLKRQTICDAQNFLQAYGTLFS